MLGIKEWSDRYLKRLVRARQAQTAPPTPVAGNDAAGRPRSVESSSLLGPESPESPRMPSQPSFDPDMLPSSSDDEAPGLKSSKGKKVKRKAKDDNKDGSKEQVIALDISDAEGGESEASRLEGAAVSEGLTQFNMDTRMMDEDDVIGTAQLEELDWGKLWSYDKASFWKRVAQRAPYYLFPVALWLPRYSWKRDLLSDIVAGIGVGCMLVPQGLAYAIIAGVPPVMGLYSSFIPILIFASMTTSRHMHFGPDALSSLLVGLTMLKPDYAGEEKEFLASVFAFIVGFTMLILGIFRFGFLDNILSRPLLSGFVNAVAVIIFVNQLEPFFGLPASHAEQAWQKIAAVVSNITNLHVITLIFGCICLTILIALRVVKWRFNETRWLKYVIDTFLIVVFGISFSYGFNMESYGVKILGAFPATIPMPEVPRFQSLERIQSYYVDAVIICIIGFVETIVAAKIYATKHNYTISPNRELVALGAANFVGSFFHTYPAFGTLTRSAVADFLGAKSQLYAYISALIVLITILFLGPVVFFLPRVTMSAIIMIAAYSLIELHDLLFLWKIKAWKEISLLLATFTITFILGVDLGIFIGIGISLMLVVAHTSVPHITILAKDFTGSWNDASKDPSAHIDPSTLVVRIEEGLYFANIEQIKDMFKRIEIFGSHNAHPTASMKSAGSLENIIVHCKNITEMDASAIATLYEMVADYQKRDIFICFVKVKPQIRDQFLLAGIIGALGGDRVFNSIDEAISYVKGRNLDVEKQK